MLLSFFISIPLLITPVIPLSSLSTIVPLLVIMAEKPSLVDLIIHLLFSIARILVISR